MCLKDFICFILRELEKQRLLEWEQARIAELNSQKQREQERVLKQKAHNTQLNVELSTLNEKVSFSCSIISKHFILKNVYFYSFF